MDFFLFHFSLLFLQNNLSHFYPKRYRICVRKQVHGFRIKISREKNLMYLPTSIKFKMNISSTYICIYVKCGIEVSIFFRKKIKKCLTRRLNKSLFGLNDYRKNLKRTNLRDKVVDTRSFFYMEHIEICMLYKQDGAENDPTKLCADFYIDSKRRPDVNNDTEYPLYIYIVYVYIYVCILYINIFSLFLYSFCSSVYFYGQVI